MRRQMHGQMAAGTGAAGRGGERAAGALSELPEKFSAMLSALRAREIPGGELPTYTGVLETVHLLPGRMRLRIPSLRHSRQGVAAFCEKIAHLQGVVEASGNPRTATVLLRFDPEKLTPLQVFSAARHCFNFNEELHAYHSVLWREIKNVKHAVNQTLLRKTYGLFDLRAAMSLALGAFMIRGFFNPTATGSKYAKPLNALWWFYQSISKTDY